MKKIKDLSRYYIDRDISWMNFNERILREAMRDDVPTLERLNFLGIYSNNLDEFYRVRIAALRRLSELSKEYKDEREKAQKTLDVIQKMNKHQGDEFEKAVERTFDELRKENIYLVDETQLDADQQKFVLNLYETQLNGQINPIWLSEVRHLSEAADDTVFLAVKMEKHEPNKKKVSRKYAIIEVPVNSSGRFIRLPDKDGGSYVMYIDDVIRFCLPQIFVGEECNDFSAYAFKFTKDAEMEIDTNDQRIGILQKVQKGLKSRKKGSPMRAICDEAMPRDLKNRIEMKLELDKRESILSSTRYHNRKDLMKFPDCGRKDLKYAKWMPIVKQELNRGSVLDAIRLRDRFIHVPYHSFDSFIRVLREAAISKDVTAIKATLYRVARNSKVINALICAANNGKKVTVVIELLARFDEASNIDWSKKMQDAGINIILGVEQLKVHAKLVHIISGKGDIACVGTGNFHEGNAKAYTDYMLMTANRAITKDVDRVFQFIDRPYLPVVFKELLVSPNEMKPKLLRMIDAEIRNSLAGKPAYIQAKINHITDEDIVYRLYKASSAGVKVDLALRGNSSLVAGIPGVSDNITIRGIIDRYLEHSRILIFCNNGDERYFIGSADWMPRNLVSRIETMVPVYDTEIKKDLKQAVAWAMNDSLHAHVVTGRGDDKLSSPDGDGGRFASQEALYNYYLDQEFRLK